MKKLILAFTIASKMFANQLQAQDTTTTLLKLPKINYLGLYVAPEMQYGQLKNNFTGFGGNSFMLLINKKLGVGITATSSLSNNYSPSGVSPLYLHSRFTGLKLEYVLNGNKAVHFTFPIVIGMASTSADSANLANGEHNKIYNNDSIVNRSKNMHKGFAMGSKSNYAFVQPGIQIETNVLKFLKIYAGATYRFAWKDAQTNTLPVSTVQGFSANVGVKVGLFEISTHKKKK
jgi:hypothetical protein